MSKLLRGMVALLLAALVIPLHAELADAGPAACENRNNNTAKKLLECVTLEGVREHQAAFQAIADANGGNRFSGLPGHDASVDYVVERLKAAGYREAMAFGMIGYGIPLERYPDTYNGQPLGYVALAAQKDAYSLYLNCAYQDSTELAWLEAAWRDAGKKLDMGKSCVRFKTLEDLPLDVVGRFVARTTPESFIAQYEKMRGAARPPAPRARHAKAQRS